MEKNIAVIKGDGFGPEIVNEAIKVLDAIANKYNHKFNYTNILMGGASIDEYPLPLTDEALQGHEFQIINGDLSLSDATTKYLEE